MIFLSYVSWSKGMLRVNNDLYKNLDFVSPRELKFSNVWIFEPKLIFKYLMDEQKKKRKAHIMRFDA